MTPHGLGSLRLATNDFYHLLNDFFYGNYHLLNDLLQASGYKQVYLYVIF
jgi:hypothetical protein